MRLQHISAAYSPKQMHRIVTPVLKATFFVGGERAPPPPPPLPPPPPPPRLVITTVWWGLENFCHWRARAHTHTQKKNWLFVLVCISCALFSCTVCWTRNYRWYFFRHRSCLFSSISCYGLFKSCRLSGTDGFSAINKNEAAPLFWMQHVVWHGTGNECSSWDF